MKKTALYFGISVTCIMLLSSCIQQSADVSKDIEKANKVFIEAFNQSSPDAVTACYTSNAKIFPTNSEIVEGHEAINKFWTVGMKMGIKKVLLETLSATAYGHIAIEEGLYTLYADNDHIIDQGKYIVTWRKEGGKWKIERDIWNTNSPSVETKYKICENNFIAQLAASINFAKSKKVNPVEYGKYIGGLHADGWQPKDEDHLKYFMNGYKWNMNLFKNFRMETLEQSDTMVKAKTKADWTHLSAEEKFYGVDSVEMNEWLKAAWTAIANHLNLEYKQEQDGDWIVFTVTKR